MRAASIQSRTTNQHSLISPTRCGIKGVCLMTLWVLFLCITSNAEEFYWSTYDLKVKRQDQQELYELLDQTFSSANLPVGVTLTEVLFTNEDVTHVLVFSSTNLTALSSLYTNDNSEQKNQFLLALSKLVEVKASVTGKRMLTSNTKIHEVTVKRENDLFADWQLAVSEPQQFIDAFKNVIDKTEDLRNENQNIAGLGSIIVGNPKVTHYVNHTFRSYEDMIKTMESYEANKDHRDFIKTVQPLREIISKRVARIVKQWK